MDCEVYPIQVGKIDWDTLIKVTSEITGESPTRCLDQASIGLDLPSAFPSILNFNNKISLDLQHLKHTFISFMVVTDNYTALEVWKSFSLYMAESIERDKTLLILSGTVELWRCEVISGCNDQYSTQVRQIMNEIYNHLRRAGFNAIFSNYRTIERTDGTFILKV